MCVCVCERASDCRSQPTYICDSLCICVNAGICQKKKFDYPKIRSISGYFFNEPANNALSKSTSSTSVAPFSVKFLIENYKIHSELAS